jgi:hypothetical protein
MQGPVLNLAYTINWMLRYSATPSDVALIVFESYCDLIEKIEGALRKSRG